MRGDRLYNKRNDSKDKKQVWKLLSFLLVFLFCFSIFTGCGDAENAKDAENAINVEAQVNVTPAYAVTPVCTLTPTNTAIPTCTLTPTNTVTPTPTSTVTPTNTVTPINTLTPTNTVTPTNTAVPTPTQIRRYGYLGNFEHPEFKCFTFCAIDYDSEEVIDSENDYVSVSIASLTKMMTALTAFDVLKLDEMLETVPESYNIYNMDSLYVSLKSQLGETRSFEEWLNIMLLMSACDAAETIAYYAGDGSLENFYAMMNAKAKEIDLWASSFDNAVGADGSLGYANIGTSRDMAVLAKHFCENELFFKISQQTVYKTSKVGKKSSRNIFPSSKISDPDFMKEIVAKVISDDLIEKLGEDYNISGEDYNISEEANIAEDGAFISSLEVMDGSFCTISISYDEEGICNLSDGKVTVQIFGLKTGFTDEAGRCFTFMAKRGDKKLVFAILGEAIGDEGYIDLYTDVVKMAWFYLN